MSWQASMNLCNSKATAGPSQVGEERFGCRVDTFDTSCGFCADGGTLPPDNRGSDDVISTGFRIRKFLTLLTISFPSTTTRQPSPSRSPSSPDESTTAASEAFLLRFLRGLEGRAAEKSGFLWRGNAPSKAGTSSTRSRSSLRLSRSVTCGACDLSEEPSLRLLSLSERTSSRMVWRERGRLLRYSTQLFSARARRVPGFARAVVCGIVGRRKTVFDIKPRVRKSVWIDAVGKFVQLRKKVLAAT